MQDRNQQNFKQESKNLNRSSQSQNNNFLNDIDDLQQRKKNFKNRKANELTFIDFKKFIEYDYITFRDKIKQIHSIKNSLPQIKQLDGFRILFQICQNLIQYEEQFSDPEMRQYFIGIIQSEQFQNSTQTIQLILFDASQQTVMQILSQIASLLIYIMEILNPNECQNTFKFFISTLQLYRYKFQDEIFLKREQQQIESQIKIFQLEKEKVEKEKMQYRPQRHFSQQLIIPLDQVYQNFQDLCIIPQRDEILSNQQNNDRYSRIPLKGSYISQEIYLANNFYLLREDFFKEPKESLNKLYNKQKLIDLKNLDREFLGLFYVYCNTLIQQIKFSKEGIFIKINTQPLFIRNKKNYTWKDSRRLMNGSLLILTNQSLDKIYYMTVKSQDKNIDRDFQQDGRVNVQAELELDNIVGEELTNLLDNIQNFCQKTNVLIFETKYYWESYSHFLRGIKKMARDSVVLPFLKTIVSCEKNIPHPEFINYNTTYRMFIDINNKNLGRDLILIRENWNNVHKGTLDESQFNCLRNILTKQVSIIQGPPGTGKTFVGSMAIKVLLDNYQTWNKNSRPILMICKTNHALDQFLKHIQKYEDRIVRIGSRSQEPSFQKYLFRNIKDEYRNKKGRFNTPSLRFLKQIIDKIEDKYKGLEKSIENYTLSDQDIKCYDQCSFQIKQKILDSFFKWINFTLDQRTSQYYQVKDIIFTMWWKCQIDSSQFQGILTSNQIEQIAQKSKKWNAEMQKQKLQFEKDKIQSSFVNVNELEEQKKEQELKLKFPNQDIQQIIKKKEEEESDSDNEENYIENKNDYDIDDNRNLNFLQKDMADNSFLKIKCNIEEFKKLIKQVNYENVNMFTLNYSQAYTIKAYFAEVEQEVLLDEIKDHLKEYHGLLTSYKEEFNSDDANIILSQGFRIVGMTLNGAAINSHLLKYLKSPIVLIEEAGEVLESLLIPILQPSTKQLILIGDHQQLKPQVNNYLLGRDFNMSSSLLERLVKNDVDFAQLKVQRRMNPQFADYIRLIYSQYEDDKELFKYPNVKGMPSNMYLISHENQEENIENSTTKKNKYEAEYSIKLAQYIILQGQFKEEEITILSMYLGQSQYIRRLAKGKNMHKIKVSSVDNYQGEENEIIILSLVRSNNQKKLGHTNTENRINVAFSRAKKGFYCLGNFKMIRSIEKAPLWHKIIELAEQKKQLTESIYFSCNKHGQVTKVQHYNDFDKMPRGGCTRFCEMMKQCGHKCKQNCHQDDCENYKCIDICKRIISLCGHQCQKKCYESCKCTQKVNKILYCGHEQMCFCTDNIAKEICQQLIDAQLSCGHYKKIKCSEKLQSHQCEAMIDHTQDCNHTKRIKCCDKNEPYKCNQIVEYSCPSCGLSQFQKKCFEAPTNEKCIVQVKKTLLCQHQKIIPCNSKIDQVKCEEMVKKNLLCGHQKYIKCFEDVKNVKDCSIIVTKILKCGHSEQIPCCDSIDSFKNCQKQVLKTLNCGHQVQGICSQNVNEIKCNITINQRLQCGHYGINIPCYQVKDNSFKCLTQCIKKLKCGHSCMRQCFEDCSKFECSYTYLEKQQCCGKTITVKCSDNFNNNIRDCSCQLSNIICPHNPFGQDQGGSLCSQICNVQLDCGHYCRSTCRECSFGLLHQPCSQKVIRQYICGHTIEQYCHQDPDFCNNKCDLSECSHKKKQKTCFKKCSEKCSFEITKSNCKDCDNSSLNQLTCGHEVDNIYDYFIKQQLQNPFQIPKCQICDQQIIQLRLKLNLKDITVNQYYLEKSIKETIKLNFIQELSQEELQTISLEYQAFKKPDSIFDQIRNSTLYNGVKYIRVIKDLIKEKKINQFQIQAQFIMKTIKQQVIILEKTYLQKYWDKLNINHIRLFVNSLIYLLGLFKFNTEVSKQYHLLANYKTYILPNEEEYNLKIYQVFDYNNNCYLHFITPNLLKYTIYIPITMSLCPKGHATSQENTKCQLKICGQDTVKKQYYYIQTIQ